MSSEPRSSDTAVLVALTADSDDVLRSGRLDAVRQARQFCDTLIETADTPERRPLEAHACLLAAVSPVLRGLLLKYRGRPMKISRKDVDLSASTWATVLQVIYVGRAFVSISRLPALCHAACLLQMRPLEAICGNLLRNVESHNQAAEKSDAFEVENNNKKKRVFVMVNGETVNGRCNVRRSLLKSIAVSEQKVEAKEEDVKLNEKIDIKQEKMTLEEAIVEKSDELLSSSVVKVEPEDWPLVTLTDICGVNNGEDKAMRRKCKYPQKSAPSLSPPPFPTTVAPIVIQPAAALPLMMTPQRMSSGAERPRTCLTCGRTFRSGTNLARHRRTHTGEKRYRCEACGRAFSQSQSLKYHQERVHGAAALGGGGAGDGISAPRKREFTCGVCGMVFRGVHLLAAHTCDGDRVVLNCVKPEPPDTDQVTLPENKVIDEPSEDKISVKIEPVTDDIVKTESMDIELGTVTKTLEETLEGGVPSCVPRGLDDTRPPRTVFLVPDELAPSGGRLYRCLVCSRDFDGNKNIRRHEKTHALSALTPKTTPTAVKNITNGSPLVETTLDSGNVECETCGKRFATPQLQRRHWLRQHRHNGIVDQVPAVMASPIDTPYACDSCGKCFATPRLRRRHELRMHAATTLPIAEKRTPASSGGGGGGGRVPRPCHCRICGKEFANNSNIRRHERTHEREKFLTFGDAFDASSGDDDVASRRTLSSANTHVCAQCGARFARPDLLRRHARRMKHDAVGSTLNSNTNDRAVDDTYSDNGCDNVNDSRTAIDSIGDAADDSQDIVDDSCGEMEDDMGQDDSCDVTNYGSMNHDNYNGHYDDTMDSSQHSTDEPFTILDGSLVGEDHQQHNDRISTSDDEENIDDIVLGNTLHDASSLIMDESL